MVRSRRRPGDFDEARAEGRRRHLALTVVMDRCAFCGALIVLGSSVCFRCTERVTAPWPDDPTPTE